MTPSQSPANGPLTRVEFRRIMNAVARANAPGKDARIEKAAEKRLRKNFKRAVDAGHFDIQTAPLNGII